MKRPTTFVTILLWAMPIGQTSAQSCSDLPLQPNEIWLGGGALLGGGTGFSEISVDASPGGSFNLSFRRTTGGPEEDKAPQAWGGRVGVPFGVRTASLCLLGGLDLKTFSFVDRFNLDRGEAEYVAREIGLRAAFPVTAIRGAEVSIWVLPALAYLKSDITGRTLIIGDDPHSEERHVGERTWEFAGQGGVSIRWKALGFSGGIARRPALSSGTLGFLKVGLAAVRAGNRGTGSP